MTAALKWIEDPRASDPGPMQPKPVSPSDAELLDAYSATVVSVAEQVSPAVVKIEAARRNDSGRRAKGGSGSGFLFTPDGLILTNSHVVAETSRLRISLADGADADGQLIGHDPHTDLAVPKISMHGPLP
jgi:S1-C subfamily serine protease